MVLLHQSSLRARFVIVITATTLFACILLTVVAHHRLRDEVLAHAMTRLEASARHHAESIADVLHTMEIDGRNTTLSRPIATIMAASARSRPADAEVEGSVEQARASLEDIFGTLIQRRAHYTQVRFIGRAGGWRELVRVNRAEDGPVTVPDADLQEKKHRPYLAGLEDLSPGDAVFSEISINKEHGVGDGRATIRFVRPVFDETGALFGAVVINADFLALLRLARPAVADGVAVTALTEAGHFNRFEAGTEDEPFVFRSEPDWTPPVLDSLLAPGPDAAPRAEQSAETAYVSIPVQMKGTRLPYGLAVVTEVARTDLFAEAQTALERNLVLSTTLVLCAILIASASGRRLTAPLVELKEAVTRRKDGTEQIAFSTTSVNEVGELAKSFSSMVNDLIRETARLQAVLTCAAEGIITVDARGRICDVNRAGMQMFGYELDDLIGAPVTRLMSQTDAEHHQSHLEHALSLEGAFAMAEGRTVWGVTKDGGKIPLKVSVGRADYAGAPHFVGILRDVSAQHAIQSQRDDLIEALQRSNEELDQFAYVASHDLKAPLRVIDNASRWLEEDLAEHLCEDTRESLDLLRGRVRRMDRLLDDLLEHSRIGRVALADVTVCGSELAEDIRAMLDLPDGFTLTVAPSFDEIQLSRLPLETVLLNLVSNAIRHHDRSVGRIVLDLQETAEAFVFTVSDDGPGIPPRYHEKVFEMFQTLRPRDQLESSGMGLAMVRKHVDVAGGAIEIRSDGGRGTTFVVTWPKAGRAITEDAA